MKITDLLSKDTVDINVEAASKDEVIKKAVALISKSGAVKDLKTYEEGVFKREEESTTGIGEGIAIPHCKSDAVLRPALAALVIPKGVDYNSLDGEPVHLLFLIAAPNTADNVHLDVLARLSNMLMNEDFINGLLNAKSKEEFLKVIDEAEEEKKEEKDESVKFPRLLAVTACPNGIAHTYMAEQSLKDKAKEMGISIKVETDGSGGNKNVLTSEEIEKAEGIIVAADINVEMDRFNGKRLVKAPVSMGIHEPEKLIKEALDEKTPVYKAEGEEKSSSAVTGGKESAWRVIYKHLMSGISHMLPFVIGGGILTALAFLIDSIAGNARAGASFGSVNPAAYWFHTIGSWGMAFMLPVLAGFIAYSIAGRPGLAVGMVGGFIANQSAFSISYTIDKVDRGSAGFLGAIAAGFMAGYLVKLLAYCFKWMPKSMDGLKPMLIYPVLGIALEGLGMYLLNTPFAYINLGISTALNWLGEHELTILLGALLAAMMAIDMGGPINKAAYVFGTAMLAEAAREGVTPEYQAYCYQMMAAVMIGGMVPPLGIALSANLFPQKYTKKERKDAMVNYVMGLSFITEGAIPYAAKDPLRVIPSCAFGSAAAGLLSVLFRCTLMAPHGGIFVFPLVGNWYWYLLSMAIGAFITALMLGLLMKDSPDPELGKWKGIRFHK